ncbi:lipopolysaccharide biosynthesis protein [Bradyrhizobium centrosematis]|uniref:lipopolysaccharide biosynthesis protein n=1 Tax=Bradyrhizobium centrosematis TaxID=1300039 RepID=UPI00216AA74B|nr:lipopolysaccharide biosynthesis protein [Bradyrhizobium centrosematis]MCS3765061.1 PST family polysaccharide transporter [Bradyrhizobium centrosematis]MCS3777663.1 PST family polysaccharide transporter [Bradyrhizobium centrosematis]
MALRRLAVGAALLSASNVVRLLLQFIMLPILARMLSPEEYGVVGIAMPFIIFAQIFSEGGVAQSLVKEPKDSRVIWSSLFWIINLVGLAVAAFLVIISPLVAQEYGQAILRPVISTLAIVCIVQALAVVPSASLQRAGRFGTLALADTAGAVLGAVTAVFLASHGSGAWALVGQQIAVWLARMVIVWIQADFKPSLVLSLDVAGKHIRFSGDVVTFNVINFFARTLDPLVIGRMFGTAAVGTYVIAYQLMRLPAMLVTGPIQSVFYTQVVTRKTDKKQIKELLLFFSRLISVVVFPAIGLVAAAHEPLFRLLLSEKWSGSGPIFMLFAAVSCVQAVTGLNGGVLMAMEKTRIQIRFTTEFSLIWVVCLMVVVQFGVVWIPIAYSISWFGYFPRFARMFLSGLDCSNFEYVSTMFAPAVVTVGGAAIYLCIARAFLLTDLAAMIVVVGLVVLSMSVSVLVQVRQFRAELALLR